MVPTPAPLVHVQSEAGVQAGEAQGAGLSPCPEQRVVVLGSRGQCGVWDLRPTGGT